MSKSVKKRASQFEPQEVAESAGELYDTLKQFQNDRYQSWEHCYMAFHEAFEYKRIGKDDKVDVDKLCLHLAFYLASWGMYRGSTFLLRCDYTVHENVVRCLLEHVALHDIKCKELLLPSILKELCNLYKEIKERYEPCCTNVQKQKKTWEAKYGSTRKEKNKQREFKEATPTLVTKVLMGTLGCVPAFDRYVVAQLKKYGVKQSKRRSPGMDGYCDVVRELAECYAANEKWFEPVRKKMKTKYGVLYPQMKFLDMGLLGMSLKKGDEQ